MNKITTYVIIAAATTSFLLGASIQSKADGKSFNGVAPFVTSSGLLGFFNQNNGKIYIYDNSVEQCIFQGQLDELGKAIKKSSGEETTKDTSNDKQ